MHKITRHGTQLKTPLCGISSLCSIQCRSISRNTAIAKGIREGLDAQQGERRRAWQDEERRPRSRSGFLPNRRNDRDARAYDEPPSWDRNGLNTHGEDPLNSPLGFSKAEHKLPATRLYVPGSHGAVDWRHEHDERNANAGEDVVEMPLAIPYTTAASEFLYGHSAVRAALKAGRRRLHTLYLHRRSLRNDSSAGTDTDLHTLADQSRVKVIQVGDERLPLLDKMSGGRPHNGCVLEASALPRPPITAFGRVMYKDKNGPARSSFGVEVAWQTRDELDINGSPTEVPCKADNLFKPFVLLIDDVLDPGNLGAIIRSAYFLGADAIALSSRTCAPITPVALKASAGAAEALPILSIENPAEFLRLSTKNGWKVYCGTTPNYSPSQRIDRRRPFSIAPVKSSSSWAEQPQIRYTLGADGSIVDPTFSPIRFAPTILVIGGEGKGLRANLTHNAYAYVEILPQIDIAEFGVDSLNVSVAAALLCADIVRPRPLVTKKPPKAVKPTESTLLPDSTISAR